jgi:hypothetical protein
MTNIELKRDNKGEVGLFVSGTPALGARFNGINQFGDKHMAVILIPLDQLAFGEQSVVVPFPVVERR